MFFSCQKDPPKPDPVPVLPTITTTDVSAITTTTASCGGNITSDGGAAITARGVCWGLTSNPTVTDTKTSDGAGLGNFTSSIAGLIPGTAYHVRAYAKNSVGIAYGTDVSFITTAIMHKVTIISVANGTATAPSSVANGGEFKVTAVPAIGFMTDFIDVNGAKFNLNGMNSYTVMNNTKPPIVTITFKKDVLWILLEKPWVQVLLQTRLHTGGTTWHNSTTGYKVEKYDFRPDGNVRIYYDGQEGYPKSYKVYGDSLLIGTSDNNQIITITRDSLVIRTLIKNYIMPGLIRNPPLDEDIQRTFTH